MKKTLIYMALALSCCLGATFSSCSNDIDIIENVNLTRCLTPLNLSVKVVDGDNVTFRWDGVKGADKYILMIYSDEKMTELVRKETVAAADTPVTVKLTADSEYWFKVMALDSSNKLEASKWAVYGKSVKTYAVKPTVYPEITGRTSSSVTLSWDIEAAEGEVDLVKWGPAGSDELQERALTEAEIKAGEATVEGLETFANYVVAIYYKSANRGELSFWTLANTEGYTPVNTEAALIQAAKDGGKYLLKSEGSPYLIEAADLGAGIELVGEESVDGTKPVILGEFHVLNSAADNSSFIFKSLELNGNKDSYGFPFQLKNGASGKGQSFGEISFTNCTITGYTKGLIYEWGGSFIAEKLIWDACIIYEVNRGNTQGGDGIDLRGASQIKNLDIVNNTIYNGFRTFFRIDAAVTLGTVRIDNNTIMNLSRDDSSTNNNGILGVKSKPSGIEFRNNLILYMDGNAKLNGPAAADLSTSDLGITFASNYFYGITAANFFNEKTTQAEALAGGGKMLDTDPCYKAKAGIFNVSDSDLINGRIGAPRWLMAYNKRPEDLTMKTVEGTHNWDFTNPAYFLGSVDEKMVRDGLFLGVIDNKLNVSEDGILQFLTATTVNRQKMPLDGYIAFLVDKPGSVYVRPVNINDITDSHIIIGKGDAEGKAISIKGGAAALSGNSTAQKIIIRDITEPSLIYIWASAPIGIEKLGWAYETAEVNTSLTAPVVTIDPKTVKQGAVQPVKVSWEPVYNAASYSVVFSGKTYDAEECSYEISTDILKFMDAGSYEVSVFANPSSEDIYNTQSAAGVASFAVQPEGGSESGELVVGSVQELMDAIASGKNAITLANNGSVYEIADMAITAPLHLKGQTVSGKKTALSANFTISGEIGGSVIFENLDFNGKTVASSLIKETDVTVADTIAFIGCNYHDAAKALYDNSGKKASLIGWLIFDGLLVENASDGADFIDMRAGTYQNLIVRNSTIANSCRTFIRTDATSSTSNILIDNNTFYRLCTNSSSKDNNGLLHIRSTGISDYRVTDNIFESILITETPSHANGYPKFVSKNAAAVKPTLISNNYFYNLEETQEAYSWWTVNCTKEEGLAGGGAICASDPFKDSAKGDFTLTSGVAINAGVGDPRWNPAGGGSPTSEITVNNVPDLLTAISAGKTAITLDAGEYDFTAVSDNPDISGGVLTLTSSLNLIGKSGAVVKGGFKFGEGTEKFTAEGVTFDGATDGEANVANFLEIASESTDMSLVSLKNCTIKSYKNRLYSQSVAASLTSFDMRGCTVTAMGTGGDFFDVRKGSVTAVNFSANTFANGIRTFARIDATVSLGSVLVKNNTFYNVGSVDSKDNNGIFHIRATGSVSAEKNIFASMHRAASAPSQKNGFPKLVSTASATIAVPTFSGNLYYDIDTDSPYSWWNSITEEVGTAGEGKVLTESPFAGDPARGDFTIKESYRGYGNS